MINPSCAEAGELFWNLQQDDVEASKETLKDDLAGLKKTSGMYREFSNYEYADTFGFLLYYILCL